MGSCASCDTCHKHAPQPVELAPPSQGAEEPAEVAGEGPAEPLPVADTHMEFVDTHALRELLTCGDLVLVKASYLMQLAASGTRLPRRQDLPEHGAVCDAQMVERALGELEALLAIPEDWIRLQTSHFQGIIVLSYAWASPEHPDPDCQMLREVLAPALEWYLSERAAYLQRGGPKPEYGVKGWSVGRTLDGLEDVDCCVFVDYPSMHQKPRDAVQDEQFRRALDRMDLLYGHQLTVKLRATRHLSSMSGCKPYGERGWPFFETCVSGLISGTFGVLDLGLVDWTQPVHHPLRRYDNITASIVDTGELLEAPHFAGTLRPVKELAKRATYKDRVTCPGVAGRLRVGRAVPQVPERFAAGLKTKTFTNQADADAVIQLHQRVCQRVLGSVKELGFADLGWSEEHAGAIGELCSSCPRLEVVRLALNPLGPKGVAALAEALADLQGLRSLGLHSCGAGDGGTRALCDLAAAGRFKRLAFVVLGGNNVGDAGFAALTDLQKVRPDIEFVDWQHGNPEGHGKRAYQEALERRAVEEGFLLKFVWLRLRSWSRR